MKYLWLIILFLVISWPRIEGFNNGCNKPWAVNYQGKEQCISANDILDNLYIRSGSGHPHSSNSAIVKYRGTYLINGGKEGMNAILIGRDSKAIVKSMQTFKLTEDSRENEAMMKFIRDYASDTDIIVLVARGSIVPKLSTEAILWLTNIGARKLVPELDSSYILITSKDQTVYYEATAPDRDVFFPELTLQELGCWKNPGLRSLDNRRFPFMTRLTNLNKVHSCALEASSQGYLAFAINNNNCFLITDSDLEEIRKIGTDTQCQQFNTFGLGSIIDPEEQPYFVPTNKLERKPDDIFVGFLPTPEQIIPEKSGTLQQDNTMSQEITSQIDPEKYKTVRPIRDDRFFLTGAWRHPISTDRTLFFNDPEKYEWGKEDIQKNTDKIDCADTLIRNMGILQTPQCLSKSRNPKLIEAFDGGTNNGAISVYKIDAKYISTISVIASYDQVHLFTKNNYDGSRTTLGPGIYYDPYIFRKHDPVNLALKFPDTRLRSIRVPENYIVNLFDDNGVVKQIVGPKNIDNVIREFSMSKIYRIIIYYVKNRVVMYSWSNFTGWVMALTYGQYYVPKYLQNHVRSMKINLPKTRIELYNSSGKMVRALTNVTNEPQEVNNIPIRDRIFQVKIIKV